MTYDLFLRIITRAPLAPIQAGHRMLGLIERLLPDVYPARWGNFEPIRTPADATQLSDVWRDPLFWFSERRQAYGSVFLGTGVGGNIFSSIGVQASSKRIDGASAVALLKALSAEFEADFGLLHVLGPRELEKPTPYGTGFGGPERTEPVLIVTHHILKQYIPNLYWTTVFGEPYVSRFGHDVVRAAPAAVVEELGPERFLLQLTNDLEDVTQRFEAFETRREIVKRHLGKSAFFDPDRPEEYDVDDVNIEVVEEWQEPSGSEFGRC